MKPFQLVETITQDHLIHQGIFYEPKKSSKRALLWVHGLTSTFYSNQELYNTLITEGEKYGYGFAAFNNRGHAIVAGIKKRDKRKPKGYTRISGGAGIENFKECILDIESGIDFLVNQGFSEIIVIGHSTGANKVCYFAGKQDHKHLKGVVLASPVSDRLAPDLSPDKLAQDVQTMQELVNNGKGDELTIGIHPFPITPKRFLSLLTPNSLEDQFDYGDPRPQMKYFSKIKKPLLVILGNADEYLDRAASKVKSVFDEHAQSTNYQFKIIPKALHGYNDQEKEVAKVIAEWSNSL